MKKRIGQVFSLALVVTLVIAMAVPAHADVSDAAGYVVGEFWDMMTGKEYDMYFDYWKNFVGYLAGEECPSSPDKYHHGNVPVGGIGVFGSGGTDDNGKFVWHTCDYCGEQFKVYASDLQQSYDAQVEQMPLTGYQSDGSLLWSPKAIYMWFGYANGIDLSYSPFYPSGTSAPTPESLGYVPTLDFDNLSVSAVVLPGVECFHINSWGVQLEDTYPISGYYSMISSPRFRYNYTELQSPDIIFMSEDYVADVNPKFCKSGVSYSKVNHFNLSTAYNPSRLSFSGVGYVPVYKVTQFNPPDSFDTTYNINSRPTSITGDYGIIGDNGQIIKVEGDKIVNETNNTIYNPATGQTTTITDWSYNYEDRSYTATTESGNTVTVTYGDENVTIKEGDTVYNIYYLIDGSGSETPDPGPDVPPTCEHTWTETSRTDPTCSTPGKVTSTCSKCNQTKTETIPATGHSWVVDRTVQTTYDEEGNLLQQGYTIYSCSVCGEQYKDMEGTGPPADDDTGDGGIIEFLDGLVKSLSENLHGVVELILSFFREIPPMFDDFLAFLTAMFPFLPPELMTLLSFGIAAVVLIGVIKAIRR